MTLSFTEAPILNSPYEKPEKHWELRNGIPTDNVVEQRRPSQYVTPVPPSQQQPSQARMTLGLSSLSSENQEYDPTPIINEIRRRVDQWRAIPDRRRWGVTPETVRLLEHWRNQESIGLRPFFCQVEAAETVIWLTEVAKVLPNGERTPQRNIRGIFDHIRGANREANSNLLRVAIKLATGTGKTTVMAMLIAWQAVNAKRHPSSRQFTKGFLITTPGIPIRDRLRVLLPSDPENYYEHRNIVPSEFIKDVREARVVITNYHAFRLREEEQSNPANRALRQGRGPSLNTLETEGKMLQRVMNPLKSLGPIMVFNDEGHHCYREKQERRDDETLDREEKAEAEKNNAAARLWINGLETVERKIGTLAVIDLSATPFFLQGSGYHEGTLFPWTVCDFSLIDAIESGIVKIPRVPISDNTSGNAVPVFRNLWANIKDEMPKKGRGRNATPPDPLNLPTELLTALDVLYADYEETFQRWQEARKLSLPVFIIVCNNTSTSKLVYDYISGFERTDPQGNALTPHLGHLELFRNYDDHGQRKPRPLTLLIDSEQLDSGEALSKEFRVMSADAIARFRSDLRQRTGEQRKESELTDEELLREAMNTIGKPGMLGADIRCVVSVSMLNEGWDTNTVTHILGIRAFSTQLLCEQVVGRALRRESYDLNEDDRFDTEYADVLGIPFEFTNAPVVKPSRSTNPSVRVQPVSPERDHLRIEFPRVTGYRIELPDEQLRAEFTNDSELRLTVDQMGPSETVNSGIIGEGKNLTLEHLDKVRRGEITFHLTAYIINNNLRETGQPPPIHLFQQVRQIVNRWMDEGYLRCEAGTYPAQLLHRAVSDMAARRIRAVITNSLKRNAPEGTRRIKAIVDPYAPTGSTQSINFATTAALFSHPSQFQTERRLRLEPREDKCHINWAVCDSGWEAQFCRILESHPQVKAYVKNQGLGLEVPYRMQDTVRTYIPDFMAVIDDGNGTDDPLHLVIETKGYRGEDAVEKATTMNSYWIPGVNNLKELGRWAFLELTSEENMALEFQEFVEDATNKNTASLGSEPKDFSRMNFKELLASAPLEGVELKRTATLPREVEL